jgi:hypothetical protein
MVSRSLAWIIRVQMVGDVENNDLENMWKDLDTVCFEIMGWH